MELSFDVAGREDGFALRDFLRLRAVSSTLARGVKRAGGFFINGAPAHTDARVHTGDVVSFALPPEPPTGVEPEDLPLCVVYEDAHALVLEKPAGQTVHPTRGYTQGTLANAFCGAMQARGRPAPFRPVNRLDRGTSGLVLCAMNAWAAPLLARSVHKAYYALVPGPLPDAGVLDSPIALAPGSLIQRCCAPEGKPSRTEYTTVYRAGGVCLVRCVPVTGRTHQIRVHFAFAGHPLLGDGLYGGDTAALQRPALHCGQLVFTRPGTQARVAVRAPLPPDMQNLLKNPAVSVPENELFGTDTAVFQL